MGLFTDIYNTVAKFFRQQDEQDGGDASKSVATNRLKLVLMQDRTNLTPKVLEQMRGELVDLLSKYLEMDKDLLELNFEQEGDQVALMLSIPVIRAKDEDEILAVIEERNAENEEEDDDNEDNSENEGVNKGVNEGVNKELNKEVDDGDIADTGEDSNEGVIENVGEGEVTEVTPKPKRKRSKKVSKPEGMNENSEEESEEQKELVFEKEEG